ncbi:MAG: glycoside hydrolase family 15 protein [Acidobacteria bacterium]|nr:glycoside hydrolase family 15 protein [Acidobacteriota bacterium]
MGGRDASDSPYPLISDYALIADCHSAALISRRGSIDWCCQPRFDSASDFGRLLDWDRGGFCELAPATDDHSIVSRAYMDDTLVLVTTIEAEGGEARVFDCFTMRAGGAQSPHRQLLRVAEGVRGRVELRATVSPRFDYGGVRPWIRRHGPRSHSAVGGNDALLVSGDIDFEIVDLHDLVGHFAVQAGERRRLSIVYAKPETLDPKVPVPPSDEELDQRLEETISWWQGFASKVMLHGRYGPEARRSALVLKALVHAPTGAVVAAPTTSLPESPGGSRNWDYRYSWIRDSQFTVRSLTELGCTDEADGFRRFIERTAAGSAESLQIMYGVGGERRLPELELDLDGYDGARPVRIGNAAANQLQLDSFGYLLDLAWRWHQRGESPDDDYWRFLVSLVDRAVDLWREPDCGIWEMRDHPQHFVHSKVMCWVAIRRGLQLAEECLRKAPVRRWQRAATAIRKAIEQQGVSDKRGVFVQSFGSEEVDASALLLPTYDFVPWKDERMVRTVDAIREDLDDRGFTRRYRSDDRLPGTEGAFVACTFWLAETLAHQGRQAEASDVFDRAVAAANDLGLFAEEVDPATSCQLGNFPQGLSHLSHIAAAVALAEHEGG